MLTREAVERDPELLDRLLLEHRILAEMVEHCPLKLALYDAEDRLLAWNTGYAELYPEAFEAHRTAAEHGTLTYRQVITTEVASRIADPDARAAEIDALMAAHAAADGTAVERAYSHAGCLRVVKVRLPSGGVAGFAIDINDLKDRERELAAAKRTAERAETRLAAALEAVPAALGLFDENDQLVFGNSAFFDAACLAEIYGPGSAMSDLALAAAEAGWGEVLAQPPDPSTAREMGLAGGRFTRIEATRTAAGDLVVSGIDISEFKAQAERLKAQAARLEAVGRELHWQAHHDALTGLPNRRYFDRTIEDMARNAAASGRALALMHLDLDRFKPINDSLGHAAGDVILGHVAGILQDFRSDGDFAARIGGDEFAILRIGGDPASMTRLADVLISAVSRPVDVAGARCDVGISAGIAFAAPGASTDGLRQRADAALYRAKGTGRQRVALDVSPPALKSA